VKIPNVWYVSELSLLRFNECSWPELLIQYVKQETLTVGEHGKEARAMRLITERASRRIGQMAFEIALARSRKVSTLAQSISFSA